MLRAIVFDFDGVILDTETPLYEAWRDIYAEHGVPLAPQAWIEVLGRPCHTVDFYARLEGELRRPIDRAAMKARFKRRAQRRIATLEAMAGVAETIEAARALGLRLAIASGSTHEWVDGHVERLGLSEAFEFTICSEDTDRHKPDPAPYRAAVERLGVSPGEALALEDSENGIASAKGAGLLAVAVPSDLTRGCRFEAADWRVESLRELDLSKFEAAGGAGREAVRSSDRAAGADTILDGDGSQT